VSTRTTSLFLFLSAFLITGFLRSPALLAGQDLKKNPLEGNADAISTGKTVFEARCYDCHGNDAKGGLGPDLTVVWAEGATDATLFQTIRNGVTGTAMPRSNAPDDEIWAVLAYLRSIAVATAPVAESVGDAANGERIFRASCSSCHRINGQGGDLGPDLSRIGSRGWTVLIRKIRNPSATIVPGYLPVTLVTSDGRRIRGVKSGEDAYSIRIMDTNQRLQGYLKQDLREVIKEKASLMPEFSVARLSDHDLDDLVSFLSTLRGANARRP
jgi:putative heme-binding domain-containing protein